MLLQKRQLRNSYYSQLQMQDKWNPKKETNLDFGWDLIRTSIGGMIKWMGICFLRNGKRILECIRYFHIFCLDLRPFIEKETITLWKPLFVEKPIVFTLYYLSDEVRMRKVTKAFDIGKATTTEALRQVYQAIFRSVSKIYLKPTSKRGIFSFLGKQ